LITFVFCKKEGNVRITDLKILGVLTGFDNIVNDNNLPKMPMVEDSLTAFSNGYSVTELDLLLGLEIEKADVSGEFILLIFSLCIYLNQKYT
jgi:hypothetical protein